MPDHNTRIGLLIASERKRQLFDSETLERLQALGDVRWIESAQSAEELLQSCTVAVGSWGTAKPTAALLDHCPDLRLWVHAAGTVKGHFGPHLAHRDLRIVSCASAIAHSVAEYTIGLMITGLYRLPQYAWAHWNHEQVSIPENAPRRRLFEATVGVVGASQVGRRVIHLLQGLCKEILVYDPYLSGLEATDLGVTQVDDLTELCRKCHVVTLHTPDLPATRKMVGREQFQAMADDAVFVNTSRGVCVDQPALETELCQGRLLAFLDVTTPEPLPPDYPHRDLPNLVVTPHRAGGPSVRIGEQAVAAIEAYQQQKPIPGLVTESMLAQLA